MNNKSKSIVALATCSFLFLGLLVLVTYVPNVQKNFGVENFYSGSFGEDTDPKVMYSATYRNVIAEDKMCLVSMTKSEKVTMAGRYIWIAESKTVDTKKKIKALATDESMTVLKPFTKNGQNIVAPAQLTFINSNVLQYSDNSISIVAYIGTDYVIEFENVKTWWCHIGKSDPVHHTEVVGISGMSPKCSEGYIIGQAKKETLVKLYKVGSDESRTPYSFYDLLLK